MVPYLYPIKGRGFVPVGEDGREALTLDAIAGVAKAYSERRGFVGYSLCYRVYSGPGALVQGARTNYDEKWVNHYQKRGYVNIDPVLVEAQSWIAPLTWREVRMMDPECEPLFRDAEEHGMKDGLCLPLHGPYGSVAVLNFASSSVLTASAAMAEGQLGMFLGCHLFNRLVQVISASGSEAPRAMSPRQKTVMGLIAEGQTYIEIAKQLKVSVETVKGTLKEALLRLGVATREQGIVTALFRGQLGSHPMPTAFSYKKDGPDIAGTPQEAPVLPRANRFL